MTCKCLRQENVVRCYEKCGDDEYYRRLALGEKGQQQIFCSQRRPGEPDDLPIIGSDGPSPSKKENKAVKPKKADAPVVPPPKQQPSVPQDLGWERRNNGVVVGSSGGGGSMVRNLDVEGSAARTAASAGAVAASIVAVVLNFY